MYTTQNTTRTFISDQQNRDVNPWDGHDYYSGG